MAVEISFYYVRLIAGSSSGCLLICTQNAQLLQTSHEEFLSNVFLRPDALPVVSHMRGMQSVSSSPKPYLLCQN